MRRWAKSYVGFSFRGCFPLSVGFEALLLNFVVIFHRAGLLAPRQIVDCMGGSLPEVHQLTGVFVSLGPQG